MNESERPGEPELVDPDAGVVAGEDDLPRQPTLGADPFTPAPTHSAEPRWASRAAWLAIGLIVAFGAVIAVWAAFR